MEVIGQALKRGANAERRGPACWRTSAPWPSS